MITALTCTAGVCVRYGSQSGGDTSVKTLLDPSKPRPKLLASDFVARGAAR